jgi:hypothetical protein
MAEVAFSNLRCWPQQHARSVRSGWRAPPPIRFRSRIERACQYCSIYRPKALAHLIEHRSDSHAQAQVSNHTLDAHVELGSDANVAPTTKTAAVLFVTRAMLKLCATHMPRTELWGPELSARPRNANGDGRPAALILNCGGNPISKIRRETRARCNASGQERPTFAGARQNPLGILA